MAFVPPSPTELVEEPEFAAPPSRPLHFTPPPPESIQPEPLELRGEEARALPDLQRTTRVEPRRVNLEEQTFTPGEQVIQRVLSYKLPTEREKKQKALDEERHQRLLEQQQLTVPRFLTRLGLSIGQAGGELRRMEGGLIGALPLQILDPIMAPLTGETKQDVARRIAKQGRDISEYYRKLGAEVGGGTLADIASEMSSVGLVSAPTVPAAIYGGLPAAAATAGMQSLGSTYDEAVETLKSRGRTQEQAEREALLPAYISGSLTAAITAGYGRTGVEALANGFNRRVSSSLVGETLKQAGLEGLEELTDQISQEVLAKITFDPERTIDESIQSSLMAGGAGTLLGGATTGVVLTGQRLLERGRSLRERKRYAIETEPQPGGVRVQPQRVATERQAVEGTGVGDSLSRPAGQSAAPFTPPPPIITPENAPVTTTAQIGPQFITAPATTLAPTMETARKVVGMSPNELFANVGSFNRINLQIGAQATPQEYAELKLLRDKAVARLKNVTDLAEKKPTEKNMRAMGYLSVLPQFYNEAIAEYDRLHPTEGGEKLVQPKEKDKGPKEGDAGVLTTPKPAAVTVPPATEPISIAQEREWLEGKSVSELSDSELKAQWLRVGGNPNNIKASTTRKELIDGLRGTIAFAIENKGKPEYLSPTPTRLKVGVRVAWKVSGIEYTGTLKGFDGVTDFAKILPDNETAGALISLPPDQLSITSKPAPQAPTKPSGRSLRGKKPAAPTPSKWKSIGRNAKGQEVFEDESGVRSYVEGSVRVTEPVQIIPTREGVQTATTGERSPEFELFRETITPSEDTPIGKNDAGEQLYQRADGSVYRMHNGKPDFGGDLSPVTTELKGKPSATEPRPDVGVGAEPSATPSAAVATWVQSKLSRGEGFTSKELFDQSDVAFGGTQGEGKYTPKDAYDAMELGVNRWILNSGMLFDTSSDPETQHLAAGKAKETVRLLKEVVSRLPTQTKRTAETDEFQQFSTPPPLAYVVAWVSNINASDVVLEPSAGIGGIAVFAKNAGATVIVNELSPRRASLLQQMGFDLVTTENGEQLHNILPPEIKPTVVDTNPPFSSTAGRMKGQRKTSNATLHLEQDLLRLEPGGRLVAIVGEGMAADRPAFKAWWRSIQQGYHVLANIGISGEEYKKYGTSFGNQIIVIDKPLPNEVIGLVPPKTGKVEKIEDLIPLLEDIRNERKRTTVAPKQPAAQPARPPVAPEGETETRPVAPAPVSTGGVGAGSAKPTGGTTGAAAKLGGRSLRPKPGKTTGVSAGTRPGAPAGERPAGERPAKAGQPAAGGDIVVTSAESARAPESAALGQDLSVEAAEVAAANELEVGAVFEQYRPQVIIQGAKPHPTPLAESAAMASVKYPFPNYKPSLPSSIITSGQLSDAQMESVLVVGAAHQRTLPDGRRRGAMIGDGTGVGKGRQNAAILFDNWNQGRKKGMWITADQKLFPDAQRDIEGIGWDKSVLFLHKKAKAKEPLEQKEGVLFSAYSLLRNENRFKQIVDWLGKDFDGVIVFDESHKMANAVETKGARGKKPVAGQALAGIELQNRFPNARIVYVSATGATEVSNLAYGERLGLWGEGTPFANRDAFIQNIGARGVGAMEIVAKDLKSMGAYLSRNLSFNGVTYEQLSHDLTAEQQKMYNTLAGAWQLVLRNMNEALEVTQADNSSQAKSAARSAFWGAHQRFFNQLLTSLQMPTVLAAIKRHVDNGDSVVLQLVNTNEQQMERAISKATEEAGEEEEPDLETLDITPRETLIQYVENAFPVDQFEEYTDDNGVTRSRPVLDSNGNRVKSAEAVAMREALINRLASVRVPVGALDEILETFGESNVAEVTGRTRRVVTKDTPEGRRKVIENRNANANLADRTAFNDDKKKILVFSDAGGTGASYHADRNFKNQRKRQHIVLQPGWRADNAIQGLGRSHRSNQAQTPHFVLASTNVPGHKRFVSTIARRIEQLGALTKGQRQTTSQGIFNARDNLESPYAKESLRAFMRALGNGRLEGIDPNEFADQTGLKLFNEDGQFIGENIQIGQFLNRLLSLNLDMQDTVFEAFSNQLDATIEWHKRNGTLDVGMETLVAMSTKPKQERTIYTDPETGATTNLIRLEQTHPTVTVPWSDSWTADKKIDFVVNKRSGMIWRLGPAQTRARSDGTEETFRMSQNPRNGHGYLKLFEVEDKFDPVEKDQAQRLWQEAYDKAPKTYTQDVHLITGTILPVLDRIPGFSRIARAQEDGGRRHLGVIVHQDYLPDVERNFGLESKVDLTPEQAVEQVMEDGASLVLSNGWRISRRYVSGEHRMEISGPEYSHQQELERNGVISERISYQMRYFIPTRPEQASILERVIKFRPIVEVSRGRGQASLGRAGSETQQGVVEAETVADLRAMLPQSGLTGEAQRLIEAFLDSPLANTLDGLRFRIADTLANGWQGSFFEGIVTVLRTSSPETAPHEFFHEVAGLLKQPENTKIWSELERLRVEGIRDMLENTNDERVRAALEELLVLPTSGADEFLSRKYPSEIQNDVYPYSSTEEFFAHSATKEFKARTGSLVEGFWARLREIIKNIISAIRKALRLTRTREQVLRDILNGNFTVTPKSRSAFERRQPAQASLGETGEQPAGRVFTQVSGKQVGILSKVPFVPRETQISYAEKVFREFNLPVIQVDKPDTRLPDSPMRTQFRFSPDGDNHDAAANTLADAIEAEFATGDQSTALLLSNLTTSLANSIADGEAAVVGDDGRAMISAAIRERLFNLAQTPASQAGQLLAARGQHSFDPEGELQMARDVEVNLRKIWGDTNGGPELQTVMRKLMVAFRGYFTDAEIEAALKPQNIPETVQRLITLNASDIAGRVLRVVKNRLKPQVAKTQAQKERQAKEDEAIEAMIRRAAELGHVEPAKLPNQKLTPDERLKLLSNPKVAVKVEQAMTEAIEQAEFNAGWKAEAQAAKTDEQKADVEERKALGEQPSPEMIEKGLELPEYRPFKSLRDEGLGYSPTTVKAVRDVIASRFKGVQFEKPGEKPPDTRADLKKLAVKTDAEVAALFDAQVAEIKQLIAGASTATVRRVTDILRDNLSEQLKRNRKLVVDKLFAARKTGKEKPDAIAKLKEKINAELLQDQRLTDAQLAQRASEASAIRKTLPNVTALVREILEGAHYKPEDIKADIATKLSKKLGLDADQAKDLAGLIYLSLDGTEKAPGPLRKAADKALETVQAELSPPEKRVFEKGKTLWQKIERGVRAKLFDPGPILAQMAAKAGYTIPTEEQKAQIKGWAEKEQALRTPTKRQIELAKGNLAVATQQAVDGTYQERTALIRKIQANWSRWSMPVNWRPNTWENPDVVRNNARAVNEFVASNLLTKAGFIARQFWQVVPIDMTLNAANRALVHALERAEASGGFSPEIVEEIHQATTEMLSARLQSLKATVRQAERVARGHANRKVLDRAVHAIGIFDRALVKADEMEAQGNKAGAIALRLTTLMRAGYRVAEVFDAIQSVGMEWQEMRHQLVSELRKAGKTKAEIEITIDDMVGSIRSDMAQAKEEARLIGLERGIDKDQATIEADAWRLVKSRAYDKLRTLTGSSRDFRAENEALAELHSWNVPIKGGVGGVIAGSMNYVKSRTEEMGLPTGGIFSFANAMGTAADRMLTFAGFALAPKFVRDRVFGESKWHEGERNQRQRRIESTEGLIGIAIVLALVAAGKALVQTKYPDDRDEKERFIAEGHKINTLRFNNDDGTWVELPITQAPLNYIASPLYMIGGVQRLLSDKAREQAKLNEEAARKGVEPGKVDPVGAGDVASVLAQGFYGLFTGGRTAQGKIQSYSDYGKFNFNRAVAGTLSPYIPGLPAWQEASRAMGVNMDTRTATITELLVPQPWSGNQRVNSLGDPLVNQDDYMRLLQVLSGGFGAGRDEANAASNHAYRQLFNAGYAAPEIVRNKGYEFNGVIRPMTPDEHQRYVYERGTAFKQEISAIDTDGLSESEARREVRRAYQTANRRALAAVGVAVDQSGGQSEITPPTLHQGAAPQAAGFRQVSPRSFGRRSIRSIRPRRRSLRGARIPRSTSRRRSIRPIRALRFPKGRSRRRSLRLR